MAYTPELSQIGSAMSGVNYCFPSATPLERAGLIIGLLPAETEYRLVRNHQRSTWRTPTSSGLWLETWG